MSRIDELIKQLCPRGVAVKTLGDVGMFIRGNGMQKVDLVSDGFPAIHYGQIHSHYSTSATETLSFVTPEFAAKMRKADPGDVVIATTSEDDEAVGKAVAWLGDTAAAVSGDAYIYRHSLVPKYVVYFLQSQQFQQQKKRSITGTKVKRISGDSMARVKIPIPPVDVQCEIVRVLDSFASLEAALQVQLDAELAARRRQYTFYRNAILHSKEQESRIVRLDQVTDITVGYPFKSTQFSDGGQDAGLVRGDNVGQGALKQNTFKRWRRGANDGLERYELRAGDVVLAMDRPWIPAGLKWARITEDVLPALLVQRVARLRAHDEVLDQRFLGWVISSPAFTEHVLKVKTGNTVPHISGSQIGAYNFELPALTEQLRIAATLDRLDELVSDLAVSIPAERSARRKQYEHYREKLLSFDEAVA